MRFLTGRFVLLMLAVLYFGVCGISLPAVAEATPRRSGPESRILIITSQPYATEWFNSFNSKFAEEIDRLRPFEPKISYEYIDGKIVDAPELATTVVKFLQQKYIWENVDLIVGIMPAGSAFHLNMAKSSLLEFPNCMCCRRQNKFEKCPGKHRWGWFGARVTPSRIPFVTSDSFAGNKTSLCCSWSRQR